MTTSFGDSHGPGIRFPPPFYFLSAGFVAHGLYRLLPFEIDGAGPGDVQWMTGLMLVVAASVLVTWAIATMLSADTAIRPDRPASRLVAAGPYRFTRNPIYCGMTGLYVGSAMLANSAWALVLLPVVLVLVTVRVIGREERHLRGRFGAEYDDYCRRVRRWV